MTITETPITDLPSLDVEMTPRQIAVHALRTTTRKQCWGLLELGERRCALGVIAEALGFPLVYAYRLIEDALRCGLGFQIERLNDQERKSFAEIADWLEAQP